MRLIHVRTGKEYEATETIINFKCSGFAIGERAYLTRPINKKTDKPWQSFRYRKITDLRAP